MGKRPPDAIITDQSMCFYFWRNKRGIFLRICQRQHAPIAKEEGKSWRIDKGRI
jgi:hypothetical protein